MNWNEYLMNIAKAAAAKSKDTTKVGAVIVDADNATLGTGFNGLPMGVKEAPERLEKPAKYLWTSHAEMNAIAFAAKHGVTTKGKTLVVTHMPCSMCARMIVQAGFKRVVFGTGTTSRLRGACFARQGWRLSRYDS
jgi:dCMP deaminase